MNLVNNAFEAIEIKGSITLSTTTKHLTTRNTEISMLEKGDYILLQVSDSGPGIPADSLQHIFEPFYTKKVMGRSGTGLGLAVVWNSVLEHKGTVDVTSNDNGTTFTVYLPVTTKEKITITENEAEDLRGTASILVVDDEKLQRDISNNILTKLGYTVQTAESGENAIIYLQNHSVDLVLLDMLMEPGLNGYQTYKEISELHPGQKAIIVSGFSESNDVKATLQLGANEFIKKPYSIELLGRTVKSVLR